MKLRPEYKAPWLAALRSKQYEQGMGHMRKRAESEDKTKGKFAYCCLGVLREVVCDITKKDRQYYLHRDGEELPNFRLIQEVFEPDPKLTPENYALGHIKDAEIWGVRLHSGSLRDISLYDLNDSSVSFEEIADLIEEQL